MSKIPGDYMERVYAGWLAKVIGIRLGAAVEGWTYERIRQLFGELTAYPATYKNFAADDDSNGPLFFLRALENKRGDMLTAQDVGEALLNYAPYEHSFFWWGGYGISTEHTAYLNLRRGIQAPQSGSIEQNGAAVAEQIGGQIFIDTWGLVAPGNPELAALLAEKAASVTHGGNGVYGGIFIATAISVAFVERDVRGIMERALSFIPAGCEYARVVRAVMRFHDENPGDWRKCYQYVFENFGYDRYPGACHIIPNAAVMALALLYGGGRFDDTLNICNMCGWDTDCNVGNVATIMGVKCGVSGIDLEKWFKPINDLLICSSVMGSLNIQDIPYGASYIASWAYRLAGEEMPEPWRGILSKGLDSCHFEYPGSTHALRVRTDGPSGNTAHLINSGEMAYTGRRSLKFFMTRLDAGQKIYLYKQTYYRREDFSDSRYDPDFSPTLYPGQVVKGSICIPEYGSDAAVCMYARDTRSGQIFYGQEAMARRGEWNALSMRIPPLCGGLVDEAGFCFTAPEEAVKKGRQLVAFVDDLLFEGQPDYAVEFSREEKIWWSPRHSEVTQITRLKGETGISDGQLSLRSEDFAEAYTGRHDFTDYTAVFCITPMEGSVHAALFRVQGAIRSYAAGFLENGRFALMKNDNGYCILNSAAFDWKHGREYEISVAVHGSTMEVACEGIRLHFMDHSRPWLTGAVGVSCRGQGELRCRSIRVKGEEP